jgi:methyl-accepting chemotaxis protein
MVVFSSILLDPLESKASTQLLVVVAGPVMRLSLKTTLPALFGLVAMIAAAQGALTLFDLSRIRSSVTAVASDWLPSFEGVSDISSLVDQVRISQYRLVIASTDDGKLEAHRKQYAESLEKLADARKRYEPLIAAPAERALYDEFTRIWTTFIQSTEHLDLLMSAGSQAEAQAELISPAVLKMHAEASAALARGVAYNREGARRDVDASVAGTDAASHTAYIAIGIAVLAALGAMVFSIMRISRPITQITGTMSIVASGDANAVVPYRGRRDELGAMASAVQVFKDNLIRTRALEQETALARAGAEAQRKAAMREMADGFERAVSSIVETVTASAADLQETAQGMAGTATQTARQSTTVAASADEAADNVNTVAAAAEELGSSVQEIGRQVNGSANLAQRAVEEAGQTAALVQELSGAVAKIGDVVAMISTIAGQTNLLALNATIEAARAGEAGRGFAVVATEVKELATQTARATDEISSQISRIQGSTGQAVGAIESITARIQEISGVATTIAAAVEEQGAATQEIVRNVSQAAAGTSQVTRNIGGVASAAEQTGAAASQVLASASELSRQSEHLSGEVDRFLATVRAA